MFRNIRRPVSMAKPREHGYHVSTTWDELNLLLVSYLGQNPPPFFSCLQNTLDSISKIHEPNGCQETYWWVTATLGDAALSHMIGVATGCLIFGSTSSLRSRRRKPR